MESAFKSNIAFNNHFNNNESCLNYIEDIIINNRNELSCNWCGSCNITRFSNDSKTFKCNDCRKNFTHQRLSVFRDNKNPLQKWFNVLFFMTSTNKNISTIQLGKNLGLTAGIVWKMCNKVRKCMYQDDSLILSGIIEVDEAFVSKGGTRWTRWGGISTRKAPIFGMIERDTRKVIIKEVIDRKRETLVVLIEKHVKKGSTIYTDGAMCYRSLNKKYKHEYVEHSTREYVRGEVHTNNIENTWRLLKSNIRLAHHHVSQKHLQLYLDELCFKINYRNLSHKERFDLLLYRCLDYGNTNN